MSLSSFVSLSVEVDWDGSGTFDGGAEDVSAATRWPVTTARGRSSATDEFRAGTCSFALNNETGTYAPFNTGSSLYPNVLPGREFRVRATYNAVTYPIFRGYCSPESMQATVNDPHVIFSGYDAFELLRLGRTNTDLLVDNRVDEIITAVLDDIGWSATLRDLDVAIETLPYFSNHNRLPLNAIQLAATQEMGGAAFIARDGDVTFQNRHARSQAAVSATLAGTFEVLTPDLRQEDVVDTVRGTYARFALAASPEPVWTCDVPIPLQPGTNTVKIEFDTGIAVSSLETPIVGDTEDTYSAVVIADSPVGYWRLDESSGATTAVDQMATYNGTYVGTPDWGLPGALGAPATALGLDGSGDHYVTLGDVLDFSGTAAFTWEAWVYPTGLDEIFRRVIGKQIVDGGGIQGNVLFVRSDRVGIARWRDSNVEFVDVYTELPIGQWTHLVATYGSSTLKLYINGVLKGEATSTQSVLDISTAMTFGYNLDPASAGERWNGRLDEIAIYGTALSQAQITEHYDTGRLRDLTASNDALGSSDKTNQMTLSGIVQDDSNSATLTLVNADASVIYLDEGAQVRGTPVRRGQELNEVNVSVASPIVTGQKLDQAFEWQDDEATVLSWANWQAVARTGSPPRPLRVVAEIVPDTDALMATVLGAEVGDKVVVTDTGADWLTGINGTFTIEKIRLQLQGPALVRATWDLFEAQLSGANMFIIGTSTISGTDPIGY